MKSERPEHPIKKIRKAMRAASEASGLRDYSSIRGFSRWLGRSESLIRNVESGLAPFSENLAKLIESKTGVSSEWMLSSGLPATAMIDTKGNPWSVSDHLDPYAGAGANVRSMLITCPGLVPGYVGKMVEARLRMDLTDGSIKVVTELLSLLKESGSLGSPEFERHLLECFTDDQSDVIYRAHEFFQRLPGIPSYDIHREFKEIADDAKPILAVIVNKKRRVK